MRFKPWQTVSLVHLSVYKQFLKNSVVIFIHGSLANVVSSASNAGEDVLCVFLYVYPICVFYLGKASKSQKAPIRRKPKPGKPGSTKIKLPRQNEIALGMNCFTVVLVCLGPS